MSGDSFHELRNVLGASDSAEAVFGSEQTGRAPAMSHVAAGPAFDSAGDPTGPAEYRFDRVRAREESSEVSGQPQPDDRQRFFQAFAKTAGGIAIDGLQPGNGFSLFRFLKVPAGDYLSPGKPSLFSTIRQTFSG